MALYRLAAVMLFVAIATPGRADELTRDELQFFEAKIRPVLIRECYGCHSNKAGKLRGGLRLDTKELMHIGGSSPTALVQIDVGEFRGEGGGSINFVPAALEHSFRFTEQPRPAKHRGVFPVRSFRPRL